MFGHNSNAAIVKCYTWTSKESTLNKTKTSSISRTQATLTKFCVPHPTQCLLWTSSSWWPTPSSFPIEKLQVDSHGWLWLTLPARTSLQDFRFMVKSNPLLYWCLPPLCSKMPRMKTPILVQQYLRPLFYPKPRVHKLFISERHGHALLT